MGLFKNKDWVKFQVGYEWRYGQVISEANLTQTDNPLYFTYAVKLQKKMPGHNWDAMLVPGAFLKKADALERMALIPKSKKRS
jgi:hypothetical protein